MIVVAIIGILAAIAVPNFVKYQCRAKQTEAKRALKALLIAEDTYRHEHDTYIGGADAGELLSTLMKGPRPRYNYSIVVEQASTFVAQAAARPSFSGEIGGDLWQIDHKGFMTNIVAGCE